MPEYRRKSTAIEAMQYAWDDVDKHIDEAQDEVCDFTNGNIALVGEDIELSDDGHIFASQDDFIVKGADNEFYPVHPNLFNHLFEEINPTTSDYSDMPAATINAVIEAYSKVTGELIDIGNPCSCCDAEQVIADIKKTESEWNSLTHSDDLSQMLEDEHPEAGKIVREYFKDKIPFDLDTEDYASR